MRFRRSGINWEGRRWTLTNGGVVLAREVEAIWPDRHPTDGTVASKGHDQRNPNSDHRPRPFSGPGVVRALDVGENVEDDGIRFAEMLRASRDPRIKYVLHEDRIFSSYSRSNREPWEWAPLNIGHPSHVHVSFTELADTDSSDWNLDSGDDMPLSDEDVQKVAAAAALATAKMKVKRGGQEISWIQETADIKTILMGFTDAELVSDAELDAAVAALLKNIPDAVLERLKERLAG